MTPKKPLHSITLVVKAGVKPAEDLSLEVQAWLAEKGIDACRLLHPHMDVAAALGPEKGMILVFGGDGTVVSVCRRTLGSGVAVAGINFGRVGFLTELSPDNWKAPLEEALESGVRLEKRMSLRYRLLRRGACFCRGEVVNDVVVTRGKVARLASLDLEVNSNPFVSLRSDGLILSTPTGASGYAGSAGGPLVLPGIDAYIVAAICPYLSNFPPLVLTPETLFTVRVTEAAPDLYLTMDGQEAYELEEGDQLDVWGEPKRILMANFGLTDYFDRICRAGFVQVAKKR